MTHHHACPDRAAKQHPRHSMRSMLLAIEPQRSITIRTHHALPQPAPTGGGAHLGQKFFSRSKFHWIHLKEQFRYNESNTREDSGRELPG
jgi:hypothetical protein